MKKYSLISLVLFLSTVMFVIYWEDFEEFLKKTIFPLLKSVRNIGETSFHILVFIVIFTAFSIKKFSNFFSRIYDKTFHTLHGH